TLLLLLLLALFALFRRGWIGFWTFVAYISIISGITVLAITNNGIWPLNIFTRHAALFGSMIEMIVLAVLMGVMLRNVQGSRFRSNAEEKLGKDMENKANEYARQLQTEILDRAAADLLLPLESIRAAASFPARTDVPSMNPSVLSTVALPPGSRTLLEEIREESSRMIRELQSLQKTSTNTPELPLSMALEETAAEALDFAMRSWKFRNTATKESVPLPDSARKTLKQFLRRMRADGAGPESRGRDGATLLSLDSDPATGGKDLEIRIRYGEESLAIVLPARQSHFRGEPIGPEMTGPRIADASQDVDILIFGADPVLQRYMELIARKNGLKLGVANLLEPIPEGGLIHILDLSQLSLEEPQSLEKMRNWLDDFPAESPLIALVGDGRLQLRDLDLDPGLDLLVYRPLNSDLFEMELLRLLYSARALRSPEKEYNIRKARSEARLQNTLRRVLGRQLERIQELAGNYGKSEADLTASREELDRRIRAAQSSLKQILRSMSD
ncbi:MAG: hypothetical protein KDK23_10700, partial [Leptospiraceae bacterium]|nr:hypothetical protein [Leptospiraceae bacterium]